MWAVLTLLTGLGHESFVFIIINRQSVSASKVRPCVMALGDVYFRSSPSK